MSCSELSNHAEAHFSLNKNSIPEEFLKLVSDALVQSYPGTDTLDDLPKEEAVSPAVYPLLRTLREKIELLPTEFALKAFEYVREGVCTWLSDLNKVTSQDGAEEVS
jgi:hypothetical protein